MSATAPPRTRVHHRTCSLCEAMCGLELTVEDERVVKVRGDVRDPLSQGFLCPKGASIGALHEDPDRLRAPLVRGADGELHEASWEEAFAAVEAGLRGVQERHGRQAVAMYTGNPAAHAIGPALYGRVLAKALGSPNLFTASTVDQFPKQLADALLFGSPLTVPVPDLDRTHFLLVLGANPWASNGSMMTAPDTRGRLKRLQARGGRFVVVDPRRTATAANADEHLAIRPGADALWLFALVHVLFAEELVALGRLAGFTSGVEEVRALAAPFSPEAVAEASGISADTTRRLARELAAAPRAAVYGRFGTSTTSFGTTTSWLVDVLNVLTGNLDREGGAIFARPAVGSPAYKGEPGRGPGAPVSRHSSRVRSAPAILGELPVACLAEELDTPGDGQVRALITMGGNPVLSTPNGRRLEAAFGGLEFQLAVDPYVNETTSHADVILPVPSALEKGHYEVIISALAIRDTAKWSDATFKRPDGMPEEWETVLRVAAIAMGLPADCDLEPVDREVALGAAKRESRTAGSPVFGMDPAEIVDALGGRRGVERLLDLMLRCGPYGAGLPSLDAPGPGELSLERLEEEPHGIDLGAPEPRLPDALRTRSGTVELAPEPIVADVARLRASLEVAAVPEGQLLLIGRRDLRSNNSWMHNVPKLVSGPARCTLQVHPDDAARLGLVDGAPAAIRSRVGEVAAPVQVTDDVRPGVVSLPHGWGHNRPGVRQRVAVAHAGVSFNDLSDEQELEPLTGTAILCGVPVEVRPAG